MHEQKLKESIPKSSSGIEGLDDITGGGFPNGRTTLLCGGPGSGKTLLGMEFIYRGASQYDEPGLFISFEESEDQIVQNTSTLEWDFEDLIHENKISIKNIKVDIHKESDSGEYNLEGLFLQLDILIKKFNARRIVLDTLETLFQGFLNTTILRSELQKLFNWLKEKKLTTIITGEVGELHFNRHSLEEFISDCVILLDHRIENELAVRRLRIIKYRGSAHEPNEFPYIINKKGISILPVTSHELNYEVSEERISSGIASMDVMLGGEGFYRGSSILITGTAGAGKTSLAVNFADVACRRGEKCVYFAFEESQSQICRNIKSIGIDLSRWIEKELLIFHTSRPTLCGLEKHLVIIHNIIKEQKPQNVILDPLGTLLNVGNTEQVKSFFIRLTDHLKSSNITSFFTELSMPDSTEGSIIGISSLIDTWLTLRDVENNGETNRLLKILKARGIGNSNQVRELLLSDSGIELQEVYIGGGKVLTGSARALQSEEEKQQNQDLEDEISLLIEKLELEKEMAEMEIANLQKKLKYKEIVSNSLIKKTLGKKIHQQDKKDTMKNARKA